MSTWVAYQPDLPTVSSQLAVDLARKNLRAVAISAFSFMSPGWRYTNSVTLAEASPGTADSPARWYMVRGAGNTAQWIKMVMTYTSGSVTKVALYYSEDNQSTYANLTDENGINYVLTLSYDGSGNLTQTSWGNLP